MKQKAAGKQNMPSIDGLRALAISLVVLCHTWVIVFKEIGLKTIDKLYFIAAFYGVSGVDLFFVISGFLITLGLLLNRNSPKRYTEFYIKRLLRIWPPYILFLVVFFVLINSIYSNNYKSEIYFINSNSWWLWLHLANFFILFKGTLPFNLTILWSLALEEQFYFIWPVIIYSFKIKTVVRICIIYLAVCSFFRWYLALNLTIDLNVFTPTRLDGFMVGGALGAVYYLGVDKWKQIKKHVSVLFLLSISYILIIMLNNKGLMYQGMLFRTFGYLAISVFYGSVLYYCVNVSGSSALYKIFISKPVALIAKHSYVIYLVHHPISWVLLNQTNITKYLGHFHSNFLAQTVYFFILYTVAIVVSVLVWHLYEKHFIRLRRFVKPEGANANPNGLPNVLSV